jgi:curli biogenesis system outer membrane secretion channel CsgG
MTKSLLWSVVALTAVALAGCIAEDSQTTQQNIDHDITVTHQAGSAGLDNIGQDGFAPWHFSMQRPP